MIPRSRLLAVLCAAACLATMAIAAPAFAAAPAWKPAAASGPTHLAPVQDEVQRVNVDAEGGTFTLSFESQTTASIAFDASPATVESALNALSSIGGAGGSVSVVGGPGGINAENPYFVSFGGSFANTDVAQMSADGSALLGATHSASVITSVPGGPGTTTIAVYAQNVGGQASSGTVTTTVTLPAGITTSATPGAGAGVWTCSPGAGQQSFTCTTAASVQPGNTSFPIQAPVVTGAGASGTNPVEVSVSGGEAADPGSFSMPLTISPAPAPPGIQTFVAAAYDENGEVDDRAGGHPYSGSTAIFVNTYRNFRGKVVPSGEPKHIEVDLPPGFLGNPIATPQCPENDLTKIGTEEFCSFDTIVGRAGPMINTFGGRPVDVPVFNVEAPFGYPGKFFFNVVGVPVHAVGSVRSDEDYGLTVGSLNTAQIATVYGSFFTFWGNPADESHDEQRCLLEGSGCDNPSGAEETAFLTSPTDCAREALEPPIAWLRLTTWQEPLVTHKAPADIPPVTGCEELEFKADFTFQPKEKLADSPGAFTAELKVPSDGLTDPDKLTTPEQKKVFVNLPEGVGLNPSAADGLEACSEAQIGLKGTNFGAPNRIRFTKEHAQCPDASKIGSVDVKSALLAETLHGAMYLAAQGEGNPFGSLFAVYLVVDSPERGIIVKLPGEVQPDPNTGQLRAVFDDIPQLPFESLKLNFKGGSRAPMTTPAICGTYTTTTLNTPWSAPESGPDFTTEDSFMIDQGPNGMPCASSLAARPFDVGFSAGSKDPIAGAKSPFSMRITRPDGNQEIDKLEISPPPGFVASLKGIPYCSEAQIAAAHSKDGRDEQSSPSCPSASQIGTTNSGAGAGPNPFYAPGKLYLAGPYKGETLSVLSVTPAVAGPFDLGNVVIRAALKLDPRTARITAISDPIPQVVEGVPLRARDIRIELDRPNWAQNPTNCEAMSVDATVFGSNGAVSKPTNRFQVGGCENLGFKPKLEIHLKGGTKRGDHPALLATLSTRDGDANIARAAVTLPPSAFLDQAHIRTVCTRVQFAANACPKGAIYGYGKAVTELLDDPIEGNVYLRSSNNKLPDLVAALKGVANIEAVGRIDSVKGGIRNTFDIIPDAPFDTFTLKMQGGKKGLVVNSQNLCAKAHRATVRLTAQNGRTHNFRPKVIADNCTKAKKGRGGKRAQERHRG